MSTSIRLVVGLGNPGREYAGTRHNVGFIVVEAFAAARGATWTRQRAHESRVARARLGPGRDLFLLEPLTFMNESGRAVGAFARFHRIEPAEMVVIYDEIQLPVGRTKLTISGSAGGHNGVASLIQHVGGNFRRLRIGVGPRHPPGIDLKDYVLGKFSPEQNQALRESLPDILAGLDVLLTDGVAQAMNRLNRRSIPDDRSSTSNHQEAL